MSLRVESPDDAQDLQDSVISAVGTQFGHTPTVSAPYPVETANLETVAAGDILGGLVDITRWQCLIGTEEPSAAVDVIRDQDHYVVVSINYGELAPRLNEVIRTAEQLLPQGDYELRSLEVPGLNFVAVHLVGEGSDLFFPILPSGAGPNNIPVRSYTAAELAASLQEAAEQVLGDEQ
jgi:hypothetical protein